MLGMQRYQLGARMGWYVVARIFSCTSLTAPLNCCLIRYAQLVTLLSKCRHHQKNTQSKKTNLIMNGGVLRILVHKSRISQWPTSRRLSRLAKACPLAPLLNLFREIASPLTVQCRKSVHRRIRTSKDFIPLICRARLKSGG